jgi:NAD(P)-dependent dehydrogenase (short-subunit alcohol dehydrogenase family)
VTDSFVCPMEQAIPLARFGKPNEIATRCYSWFPTRAKYITGQTLIADEEETLRESVSAV